MWRAVGDAKCRDLTLMTGLKPGVSVPTNGPSGLAVGGSSVTLSREGANPSHVSGRVAELTVPNLNTVESVTKNVKQKTQTKDETRPLRGA